MKNGIHPENIIELDPERQARARQYRRMQQRLSLAGILLGVVYILTWLWTGWSADLAAFLEVRFNNPWLVVPLYAAVFGGIYYLLNLPLSFYGSFLLPHRFDLSNQSLKGWLSDQIRSLLLSAIFGVVVLEVIYAVLRLYPTTWWIWASGFLLFFSVIMGILGPVLLFPLFYKFSPLEEEHADLANRLSHLAEQAGTKVRGVYKFDMSRRTKAANAALTGLGSTRRIILGDTLIQEFSPDEIETILAHELGHHVHKDLPLGIVFETVSTVLSLWLVSLGLNWGASYFGFDGAADIAAFPVFLLIMGFYGLVTMPLGNAFSRWRERRADDYALKATGKGQAYASALRRLANQNLADANPEPWIEWLLYSHPALSKRIAMAVSRSES